MHITLFLFCTLLVSHNVLVTTYYTIVKTLKNNYTSKSYQQINFFEYHIVLIIYINIQVHIHCQH